MDGEFEEARSALRDGAGVQPPAILARFVEGGRETRVPVSLSDGSPDALKMLLAAAKGQQLPRERLEHIQPDREDVLERTVRDCPGDDGAPALSGAWLPNHGHDVSGKVGRHVLEGRKRVGAGQAVDSSRPGRPGLFESRPRSNAAPSPPAKRGQLARISMLSMIGTLLVDHRRRVAQLRPRLRHTAARSMRACSLMDCRTTRGQLAAGVAGRGAAAGGIQ